MTTIETITTTAELIDCWIIKVWEEGILDLVPTCMAPTYLRHEPTGTRTVTPESYAQEIAATRARIRDLHFTFHDVVNTGTTFWVRFTQDWTDAATGVAYRQAGIQIYRVKDGKLAEMWVAMHKPGSAWPDAPATAQ